MNKQQILFIVSNRVLNTEALFNVDSRILSFNVYVDPAYNSVGEIDTSEPLCIPDAELFNKESLRIHLEHRRKIRSIRKLMFHENEVVTDVSFPK